MLACHFLTPDVLDREFENLCSASLPLLAMQALDFSYLTRHSSTIRVCSSLEGRYLAELGCAVQSIEDVASAAAADGDEEAAGLARLKAQLMAQLAQVEQRQAVLAAATAPPAEVKLPTFLLSLHQQMQHIRLRASKPEIACSQSRCRMQ